MPIPLLLGALAGLLSLAIAVAGIALVAAWVTGALVAGAWLGLGIVLLTWAAFGRSLVLSFFRTGEDDPKPAPEPDGRDLPAPDGSLLHFSREGVPGKPVLVLTHGWTLDSRAWYYARQFLAARYRLVLWDLPGLGRSTQPTDGHYSMERLAEDLRAVIEASGAARVTLVGHSIGGMMMLTLCRLHPEFVNRRVSGMVFIDTTYTDPLATGVAPRLMQALRRPLLLPMLYVTLWTWPLAWLQNWLNYFNGTAHLINRFTVFAPGVTRGQLDGAALYSARDHPGVVAKGLLAVLRWGEEETLRHIRVPVEVISGDQDRLTRPEAAGQMHAKLPRSVLRTIRQAGHNGVLQDDRRDYAAAIDAAVRGFLRGRGDRLAAG